MEVINKKYEKLKDWDKDPIKECCKLEDPEQPRGDCCYDTWQDELQDVTTKLSEACEYADLLQAELDVVSLRRDNLKRWYDELVAADELVLKICAQLEVILNHVHRINCNSKEAVEAIKILFCMIKDFFSRIDHIKTVYDQIINCLKCLDSPVLVPGQGIYKCLEDYFAKLQMVLDCKAKVIELILKAIKLSHHVEQNLGDDYGLHTILHKWEYVLKCHELSCKQDDDHEESEGKDGETTEGKKKKKKCRLKPMIKLPIHKDDYFKEVEKQHRKDKKKAEKLTLDLVEANKQKERYVACEQSLLAAIKEVDPKIRCS